MLVISDRAASPRRSCGNGGRLLMELIRGAELAAYRHDFIDQFVTCTRLAMSGVRSVDTADVLDAFVRHPASRIPSLTRCFCKSTGFLS